MTALSRLRRDADPPRARFLVLPRFAWGDSLQVAAPRRVLRSCLPGAVGVRHLIYLHYNWAW